MRDPLANARDFPLDDSAHLLQFFFLRRIVMHERLGEAHGADRQADHVLNVPIDGECELATAATEVDEQRPAVRDARVGENAEMDKAALFQSGDDLDPPAGGSAYPVDKRPAV